MSRHFRITSGIVLAILLAPFSPPASVAFLKELPGEVSEYPILLVH